MDKISENILLDDEEQWIEDNLEDFISAPDWVGKSLQEAAKNPAIVHAAKKKKTITFRADSNDLLLLKNKAAEQGLPYQTLLGSVLHKYVSGILIDLPEAKKILSIS